MASRTNLKQLDRPDSRFYSRIGRETRSITDALTATMSKTVIAADPPAANQRPGTQSSARRNFLAKLSATTALAATASLPHMQLQAAAKPDFFTASKTRELSLLNIHTLEEIEIVYWEDGKYLDDAVLRLSHHLRDHRENETLMMDPNLLDTLWGVRMLTDPGMRFNVISGYRTPKTNEMLRKRSNGVAKFSLHMVGKAVDISSDEVPISKLKTAGLKLGIGGVGYYPKSRFVHLDTGPARSW